jgi:hypothetical protein
VTEENFWEYIGLLNWECTGDDEAVIEPAVKSLSEKSVEEIYEFEELLSAKLYSLDTKAHGKRVKESFFSSYISPDIFLYWRCGVVANGQEVYELALVKPRTFPKHIDFEPLLSLSSSAYELKTNTEWDYSPKISYETYSNKEGWR